MPLPAKLNAEDILNTSDTITFVLNNLWQFSYVNKNFVLPEGYDKKTIIGKVIWDVYPEYIGSEFYKKLKESTNTQKSQNFIEFYPVFDTWFRIRIFPIEEGFIIYLADITSHRKTLEVQRFLAKAGELLSSSLDYETTLKNVAQLAVPHMGDWCGIIFT